MADDNGPSSHPPFVIRPLPAVILGSANPLHPLEIGPERDSEIVDRGGCRGRTACRGASRRRRPCRSARTGGPPTTPGRDRVPRRRSSVATSPGCPCSGAVVAQHQDIGPARADSPATPRLPRSGNRDGSASRSNISTAVLGNRCLPDRARNRSGRGSGYSRYRVSGQGRSPRPSPPRGDRRRARGRPRSGRDGVPGSSS